MDNLSGLRVRPSMESPYFAPGDPGTMMHNGVYVASRAAIGKKLFLPACLADSIAQQISIEAAQPKLDLGVLKDLAGKKIMLGVLDLGDDAVSRDVAFGKLKVLAAGAAIARQELS
jgi:hypothetical protein